MSDTFPVPRPNAAAPEDTGAERAPRSDPLGAVRITRQVLATILEQAALGVPGVDRLAPVHSPWPRFITRAEPKGGLAINVSDTQLAADLYLILKPGVNMAQVGRAVQDAVAEAVERMLGMTVGEINIYIQDVA